MTSRYRRWIHEKLFGWQWYCVAVIVAAALLLLLYFAYCSTQPAEWVTAIGEMLIAGVIYWEIEGQRAATFMENVAKAKFYRDRTKLYDAYARLDGDTKARASAFGELLKENKELRKIAEHQWTTFTRLRYMLR